MNSFICIDMRPLSVVENEGFYMDLFKAAGLWDHEHCFLSILLQRELSAPVKLPQMANCFCERTTNKDCRYRQQMCGRSYHLCATQPLVMVTARAFIFILSFSSSICFHQLPFAHSNNVIFVNRTAFRLQDCIWTHIVKSSQANYTFW